MPDPTTDFIERTGLIFRAGNYEDKNFSITPEELSAAAASFTEPVPTDLSHTPTVLDGRLGELVRVEARGGELHGTARLPRWLDELLATGQRKVSLLWDRETKRIQRLSLVPNPRIADAALFAAFSAAGGCLGAAEGCSCASCSPAEPGRSDMKDWMRKLKDVFKSDVVNEDDVYEIVAAGLEADDDGESEPGPAPVPVVTPVAAPAPAPAFSETPEYREMKARLERAEKLAETERTARVKSEAAAFAAGEVRACRALPAERANLEAAFMQAAQDDHAHGGEVAFSASGQPQKGSRVAALRAMQAARQPHALTHELVGLRDAGAAGLDLSDAAVIGFSGDAEDEEKAIRQRVDEFAQRRGLKPKGAASA